ncbi:MAG TPA: TetR/AcrR family transcriptional regulator [Gemmatimonadaceae bacterium]|nr:TetR/AcrR family transcriptional regulator [Gemmatimonadaceae bacterium]
MAKSTKAPQRPDGGRDLDTEQRILDAANAVFLRRGTAGARMQEIADEAGVNKALLHYYFRSKDRLAQAIFQRVAKGLFPAIVAVLASDAEIEEKVERVIAFELDYLSRSPFVPAYLIGEMNADPERVRQFAQATLGVDVEGIGTPVLGKLERQLRARARAGTLRPISAGQFLVNLLSLCIFPFAGRPLLAAVLHLDERGYARFIEQRKKELPAFFLNALRP